MNWWRLNKIKIKIIKQKNIFVIITVWIIGDEINSKEVVNWVELFDKVDEKGETIVFE